MTAKPTNVTQVVRVSLFLLPIWKFFSYTTITMGESGVNMRLDETDKRILELLTANGRLSYVDIGHSPEAFQDGYQLLWPRKQTAEV